MATSKEKRAGRMCPTCREGLRPADAFLLDGRRCLMYPKPIPAVTADGRHKLFNFHEYRYYCGRCRVEWIYSTQDRSFAQVDLARAEFVFDPIAGLLVART